VRNPAVLWLKAWEEAVGTLEDIELKEGKLMFDGFTVRLPPELAMKIPDLESMKGKRVRILRTDIAKNPLIIKLEEES
jgi:hypothetical protein